MLWIDFLNSEWHDWRGDGHIEDRLLREDWQEQWLRQWGIDAPVPAREEELASLLELRTLLQNWTAKLSTEEGLKDRELEELNAWVIQGRFRWELRKNDDGTWAMDAIMSSGGWNQAMAEIACGFARFALDGQRDRIRFCDNPNCKWVFLDETRNRTKRYCDDKLCGNLMKVRRFRAKKKAESDPS